MTTLKDAGDYYLCPNERCLVIVVGGERSTCPACYAVLERVKASWIAVNLYKVAQKWRVKP